MGKIVNKSELAEILGKSERTLTTWQKNGMPIALEGNRGSSHQYDTEEIIDWVVQQEINRRIEQHGASEDSFFDYESERARLTHHQANKVSLEEQVLQGKLIPSETVERVWSNMVASFRAKMLSIPTKAAHQFLSLSDLNESQDLLKDHVYEALDELSDYDAEQYDIPNLTQDNGDDSAAA